MIIGIVNARLDGTVQVADPTAAVQDPAKAELTFIHIAEHRQECVRDRR